MRPPPAILVLAAGASSRMRGADKLLEEIDGTPLVLRAVRAACAAASEVLVALPPDSPRRAWLTDLPARVLEVEDRAMSASIRAGVAACRADALTIHLADMPEIGAAELGLVVSTWRSTDASILRATSADGMPGQPVTFARTQFPALAALSGDVGARSLLDEARMTHIALPGEAAVTDLDTPEAWTAWRRKRSEQANQFQSAAICIPRE